MCCAHSIEQSCRFNGAQKRPPGESGLSEQDSYSGTGRNTVLQAQSSVDEIASVRLSQSTYFFLEPLLNEGALLIGERGAQELLVSFNISSPSKDKCLKPLCVLP